MNFIFKLNSLLDFSNSSHGALSEINTALEEGEVVTDLKPVQNCLNI